VFLGNISHPSICFCLHTQDPYRLRKHTMFYHTTLGDIRSKPAYLLFSLEIMQDPQTGPEREWQSLENNIVKNHEVKEHKRGKMLQWCTNILQMTGNHLCTRKNWLSKGHWCWMCEAQTSIDVSWIYLIGSYHIWVLPNSLRRFNLWRWQKVQQNKSESDSYSWINIHCLAIIYKAFSFLFSPWRPGS